MQAEFDTYTAGGYADFLLDQQRPQEAWDLLRPAAASEVVVLRRAIAAKRLGLSEATALRREIVERHAQADLRSEDSATSANAHWWRWTCWTSPSRRWCMPART